MSFDNRTMKRKHRTLVVPHIAKIDGFWRVSPKPINVYFDRNETDSRWRKAHFWATWQNNIIDDESLKTS